VRSYKGSGLGIPVAYGIVHLLGGMITVESEPDKGTAFTITLTGMS
jgi:signal transduction histidine kinase